MCKCFITVLSVITRGFSQNPIRQWCIADTFSSTACTKDSYNLCTHHYLGQDTMNTHSIGIRPSRLCCLATLYYWVHNKKTWCHLQSHKNVTYAVISKIDRATFAYYILCPQLMDIEEDVFQGMFSNCTFVWLEKRPLNCSNGLNDNCLQWCNSGSKRYTGARGWNSWTNPGTILPSGQLQKRL